MESDDGGDVHDRAASALHHSARRRTAGVEDPVEIRPQHIAPVLVGHACDQSVTRHTSVVDEDVEVPGVLDEDFRLLGIGDVSLDGARSRFTGDCLGLVLARAIAQRHGRSGRGELPRDCRTDAA